MRPPISYFFARERQPMIHIQICGEYDNGCSFKSATHLFRDLDVYGHGLDIIKVRDVHCINIFDEPSSPGMPSAQPKDGGKVYCMKCRKQVGKREGSLIIFNIDQLEPAYILYNANRRSHRKPQNDNDEDLNVSR